MPTIAVLGATGQAGIEVVKLLTSPSYSQNNVRIWARSLSKIHQTFPNLTDNVQIYTGSITDPQSLLKCLSGADVIISAIAQNRNEPECDISRVSAHKIVSALAELRKSEKSWNCPKLIWVSSASVSPHSPPPRERDFGHRVALKAFHYIYTDIKLAVLFLKSQEWIPLIVAEPGALVHHPATGVKLVEGTSSEIVPYKDFAKGLIEMGPQEGWDGKHVGMIVNHGVDLEGGPKLMLPLMRYMIPGLLATFVPWLYKLFEGWWPA